MGEESYPEGYPVNTSYSSAWARGEHGGDSVGDALQLMERRLGDLVPRGRVRESKRVVVVQGVTRAETLREKLERQRDEVATAVGVLSAQLAKREAQLRELDRYPAEDPYRDGDSLKFTKRFPDGREYTYMALRADGRWYVTGSRGPQGVEWARFTEWLGLGVTDVVKIGTTRNTPVKW